MGKQNTGGREREDGNKIYSRVRTGTTRKGGQNVKSTEKKIKETNG